MVDITWIQVKPLLTNTWATAVMDELGFTKDQPNDNITCDPGETSPYQYMGNGCD